MLLNDSWTMHGYRCQGKGNGNIMKIAFFLDYGKGFGGAANTILQQALLMKQTGCEVTIFFSDYYGEGLSEEYNRIFSECFDGFQYASYQVTSQPEDVDIMCLDEKYDSLKAKIVSLQPDVLHSVQLNPLAELVSRELGIPHIMNIYPLSPEFFSIDYMDIFPHYHICDSWYWARKWNQYLHTDYTCIRTVVNKKVEDTADTTSNTMPHYICVGVMDEQKNQLNVIKAFHKALDEGVAGKLFFYGYTEGNYAGECQQYIQENGLGDSIELKGFCSDMQKVYRNSDILICGSTRESYPNAVSEAMAYGLLIVSTPVAGVPEVIKDGYNGYLADGYTADDICAKLMELQQDIKDKKTDVILKNAEHTFRENHSPEVVSRRLQLYYEHVLSDFCPQEQIGICEVREIFAPWKQRFYDNYSRFTDPQKVAGKLWYLYHIRNDIEKAVQRNAGFFIWGAGKYGTSVKEMVEVFFPELPIAGFLDGKKTGRFGAYEIYTPEQILDGENIVVFVAVLNGQNEVVRQLAEHHFVFNKDYYILSARYW